MLAWSEAPRFATSSITIGRSAAPNEIWLHRRYLADGLAGPGTGASGRCGWLVAVAGRWAPAPARQPRPAGRRKKRKEAAAYAMTHDPKQYDPTALTRERDIKHPRRSAAS